MEWNDGDVVLMCLTEEQQRLPWSSTCVCTALPFFCFLFLKKASAATATTHTSDTSYLCIICVMETNSSRRRSRMYAQAGGRVQEERGCKHQVEFCRLAHSASSIVDEISYLNGRIGSCTCCVSSSRTRLEEKGVRMRWKGRVRRRFMRCASVFHRQINELPLMGGNWCAEVKKNPVKSIKLPHLSHRCPFLWSVLWIRRLLWWNVVVQPTHRMVAVLLCTHHRRTGLFSGSAFVWAFKSNLWIYNHVKWWQTV